MPAEDLIVCVLAGDLEHDDVLQCDHVTFHAANFSDVRDLARAVTQTGSLNNDVDGTCDHFADGFDRQGIAPHHDHAFETADGFARRIGVQRAHRSVVAGVHGLEQVEGFRAADFADDDAFGPHTQAVLDQVAHLDLAFAFKIRRASFEANHVGLLQLELG